MPTRKSLCTKYCSKQQTTLLSSYNSICRRAESDFHASKMTLLQVKLLVTFTYFTAVYIRGEAADTCPTTTTSCIPGLPGRDGKDGQPGRDGRDGLPGPPGSLSIVEQQQLKDSILEVLRDEISMLCHQSQQCNETSNESTNTPMPQPSNTPQPTPQPGPSCTGSSEDNPATSCKEVHNCDPTPSSGYYWVNTTTGPVQVYCEMDTNNCGNITGGWMKAAYIDMTNVNNTCPAGLNYTVVNSTRMCARTHTSSTSCSSVTFPTHGVPYTKVCGRARGYDIGTHNAFSTYENTLNSQYLSGLSVTHGTPRNHIWSFAVGHIKGAPFHDASCCSCPCTSHFPGPSPPPFVGENFFCESGATSPRQRHWYLDDPLWDSQGCVSGSTCCNRGGPWFTTTLSQGASDDIEVRLCLANSAISTTDNLGVDQLEIFVI